jgi:hypothetical protein
MRFSIHSPFRWQAHFNHRFLPISVVASRSASRERIESNGPDIEADLDLTQSDHCVVSPINRLPIQLLAKIFTHCLPKQPIQFGRWWAPLSLGGYAVTGEMLHWRHHGSGILFANGGRTNLLMQMAGLLLSISSSRVHPNAH